MKEIILGRGIFSQSFNPLSANPTKSSNTFKQFVDFADELLECVWQFYGAGA